MSERMHLIIRGRVQGVCFRMYTAEQARRLEVTGWVRNLLTGEVELVAEGPKQALDGLRDWCRRGPDHARVTEIEETFSEATGEFHNFKITG